MALTSAAATRLKSLEKAREIPDGGGLYLMVWPSGTKSWVLRIRKPSGKTAKITLGRFDPSNREPAADPKKGDPLTLASARRLAADMQRQRARGMDVTAYQGTFAEAAKDFVRRHSVPKVRRWQEQARLLGIDANFDLIEGGLADRWRNKTLDEIDGDAVHAVIDEAREKGTPGRDRRNDGPSEARARHLFAALSKMFGWLLEKRLLRQNPCAGVHRPESSRARDRVLTDAEIVAFWRAAEAERLGPVLKLLLLTGARLSEVAGMRPGEVEGATWTIPAARTKNKRVHVVPLPPLAVSILTGATEWGVPSSKLKRRLDRAMKSPPWTYHDLRRTAATGMAEIGIAPHIIEACLNHVSGFRAGVAGIYNRSQYAAEKKAAFERWAAHVEALVSGSTTAVVVPMRGSAS